MLVVVGVLVVVVVIVANALFDVDGGGCWKERPSFVSSFAICVVTDSVPMKTAVMVTQTAILMATKRTRLFLAKRLVVIVVIGLVVFVVSSLICEVTRLLDRNHRRNRGCG